MRYELLAIAGIMGFLSGCAESRPIDEGAPSSEQRAFDSEDACALTGAIGPELSRNQIHNKLLDAYAVANEAAPKVRVAIGNAVDVFGTQGGDATKALVDVVHACGEAQGAEDWAADSGEAAGGSDSSGVDSRAEFVDALNKAEEAARTCKKIVRADPTVPARYDDFLIYCFEHDDAIFGAFERNPDADPVQVGKDAARQAIEQQRAENG